jgi:hypothetical protein
MIRSASHNIKYTYFMKYKVSTNTLLLKMENVAGFRLSRFVSL